MSDSSWRHQFPRKNQSPVKSNLLSEVCKTSLPLKMNTSEKLISQIEASK